MIMRAKQEGKVIIFELEGHLDFETTQRFHEKCHSVIHKRECRQVVFNFAKLKFVGSSGIHQFIKALKQFNSKEDRPKLCEVSMEFDKVIKAYQTTRNPFEIFENESQAIAAFDLPRPPKKTLRKKTKPVRPS